MEPSELYEKQYMPYIVRWGRIFCWSALFVVFIPTLVLVFGFHARIPAEPVFAGLAAILSASVVMYFAEPLSIFPAVGTPGLYLIMLVGNSKQIRLPASLTAQSAAEVEQGSPQGGIMSCIGICVSILISTAVMTVMILIGNWLISVLPPLVTQNLALLMPALFAALLVQMVMNRPREGLVAILLAALVRVVDLAGVFRIFPLGGSYMPMLVCVFGSIALVRLMYRNKN